MSAHKNKGVVAAQTGIVVGDGKHHHRKLHVRLILFVLGVVVVAGLAAWGVVWLVNNSKTTSTTSGQKSTTPTKPAAKYKTYVPSKGLSPT